MAVAAVAAVVAADQAAPVLFDIPLIRVEIDTPGVVLSRIHILTLRMTGPVVRLSIDKAGRANWRRRSAAVVPEAVRPDHDWGICRELQVDSIEVTDGRVLFDDRRTGYRVNAEKVGLTSSNSVNTPDGPGLLLGGGAVVNGERFAMKFETGQVSKFISSDRLPVVVDVVGAPLAFRFQGGAARRQFFVVEGAATLTVGDLARFDQWLGRPFASPVAGPFSLSAHVTANGPRVLVEGISARAGASEATGAVWLRRDGAGRRIIDAELRADVLDLTPLLLARAVIAAPPELLAALYPEAAGSSVSLD